MRKLHVFVIFIAVLQCVYGGYTTFSYGGRANKLFVPSNYDSSKSYPLFVMLHGCTQDPDTFSAGTKMNTYGEQFGLIVLYPLQPSSANMNKCWNWFEPAHQKRGSGEPAFIAGATMAVAEQYNVNAEQIFVAGLSAGGAMTSIMGALYPDIYTSIGVHAGLEYLAATSTITALEAMRTGGPNPTTQGNAAWNAMKNYYKWPVETLVVQGSADYTVYPVNGDQSVVQWIVANDNGLGGGRISTTPTQTLNGVAPGSGGKSYTDKYYNDIETGATLVRYIYVTGMGHAWSGGSSSGSYTDPTGPDASLIMINYFLSYDSPTSSTTGSSTTGSTTTGPTTTTGTTTGPNPTPTSTTSGTTTGGAYTIIFESISGEDGYVGQYAVDGFSTSSCKVGDKGMYNLDTYRTVLSFPTQDMPPGAKIQSAYLQVNVQSVTGTVSSLAVDVKKGDFGGSPTLKQSDYSASADSTNIISGWNPSSQPQAPLPASALSFISTSSRTHFRLKATTSASFAANTMFISCDDSENPATLVISYTL
eukprot:TRINITY_DN508_c0_g1_i1.p1 TRINITY_DN508_c0_g1~~TRINITY_DN508_c0_g1_i1.p1  ORF type:complete len:532 (+),score=125.15 TRINITY_DN508_c0_g1_i1:1319-2914(+)